MWQVGKSWHNKTIWGKTWHNKANHGNFWHDKSEDLTRILHKKNSDMTKLWERGHDTTKTIKERTWHDQNYQSKDMTRPNYRRKALTWQNYQREDMWHDKGTRGEKKKYMTKAKTWHEKVTQGKTDMTKAKTIVIMFRWLCYFKDVRPQHYIITFMWEI